jgi:hypothetical protein
MGFEPTNQTLSPDDSIGLSSPNPRKAAYKSPILDRNWTEKDFTGSDAFACSFLLKAAEKGPGAMLLEVGRAWPVFLGVASDCCRQGERDGFRRA